MKFYPKTYKDFYNIIRNENLAKKVTADGLTTFQLAQRFRDFYKDAYRQIWHLYICQIWLEQKILFEGKGRGASELVTLPAGPMNTAFFNLEVGISPCLIVSTRLWPVVLSYFREFYPDFEQHDPFLDPDYYAFPFDHVTLDFLGVVYQVDNRMELLQEAEKQEMTFMIFKNWVLNWVLSYNDDIGEEIYQLKTQPDNTWYIKNTKRKKVWRSF